MMPKLVNAARSSRATASVGLVVFGFVACRDAVEPFRPDDRHEPVDASFIRLTYSPADERLPVWSSGGDSVYFTTSRWEGNTLAPATVLSLAADGMGFAVPLIRNVQAGVGSTNWITAPALSQDGQRIAFVRVRPLLNEGPCVGKRVCPILSNLPMVRLVEAELHARAIDATHGLVDDVILPLNFAGHSAEADPGAPAGGVTVSEYHPFQFVFETTGRAVFRPSWSPGGGQLVVSDGLRLLRWTLGAPVPVAIPGTDDGVLPAWSPDGEWIAYARYPRLDSQTFICEYQNEYPPNPPVTDCIERRTIHWTGEPLIVVTRPDGSDERVLGQGTDPAWSPDGLHVYASSPGTGGIVRMALDGTTPASVPRTVGAIEPAVSPDGRRLAFAKRVETTGAVRHDIWVVELP